MAETAALEMGNLKREDCGGDAYIRAHRENLWSREECHQKGYITDELSANEERVKKFREERTCLEEVMTT